MLDNHISLMKLFGNGIQITFPNRYTVVAKIGPGTNTTQMKKDEDLAATFFATRFGSNSSVDCEIEIFDANKNNITSKFGGSESIGHVSTMELANLLYLVSNLK